MEANDLIRHYLKRFIKQIVLKENGSVSILVALSMIVLMGFASLAIDGGLMLSEKRELQNAADAASLAAVQNIHGSETLEKVTETKNIAKDYAKQNGVENLEISLLNCDFSKGTVEVEITRSLPMSFSPLVTGDNVETIKAYAKAKCINPFNNYPYALFSGSEIIDLTLTGNKHEVIGAVHANAGIDAKVTVKGTVTCCETPKKVGSNGVNADVLDVNINNKIDMLDPSFLEKYKTHAVSTLTSANIAAVLAASGGEPIYVIGDVSLHRSDIPNGTPVCIIAEGKITFRGSSVSLTSDEAVCLCSLGSQGIEFNGGSADLCGMFYAPNGEVRLNGAGGTINGSVIANSIVNHGSSLKVSYDESGSGAIPNSDFKLIK